MSKTKYIIDLEINKSSVTFNPIYNGISDIQNYEGYIREIVDISGEFIFYGNEFDVIFAEKDDIANSLGYIRLITSGVGGYTVATGDVLINWIDERFKQISISFANVNSPYNEIFLDWETEYNLKDASISNAVLTGTDAALGAYTYNDCRKLSDILSFLVGKASATTTVAEATFFPFMTDHNFIGSGNTIYMTSIYDIYNVDYTPFGGSATGYKINSDEPISLKRLLEILKDLFNVEWYIESNVFKLIHPSERTRASASINFAKYNLTSGQYNFANQKYSLIIDNPKSETFDVYFRKFDADFVAIPTFTYNVENIGQNKHLKGLYNELNRLNLAIKNYNGITYKNGRTFSRGIEIGESLDEIKAKVAEIKDKIRILKESSSEITYDLKDVYNDLFTAQADFNAKINEDNKGYSFIAANSSTQVIMNHISTTNYINGYMSFNYLKDFVLLYDRPSDMGDYKGVTTMGMLRKPYKKVTYQAPISDLSNIDYAKYFKSSISQQLLLNSINLDLYSELATWELDFADDIMEFITDQSIAFINAGITLTFASGSFNIDFGLAINWQLMTTAIEKTQDYSSFAAQEYKIRIKGTMSKATAFTADAANLKGTLDLGLLSALTTIIVNNNSGLTHLLLPDDMILTTLTANSCNLNQVIFRYCGVSNGANINLKDNSMSLQDVNETLSDLDGTGWINGILDISGTNTSPIGGANNTNKLSLESKGWTVIIS